jgi:DNA polymerase III delta prime subunit
MNSLWINKYCPKNVKDIIGHKNQIRKFKTWIKDYKESKIKSIVVSGSHGIGKTMTMKLILEELNYNPIIIYPNEIKEFRNNDNFKDYYNNKNSILFKMNTNSKMDNKKIAIIFNEAESISLTSEKKYVFNIFKENNKLGSFPLIFIANNQHSKLLNDLKKYCVELRFFSPSMFEIKSLIKKISNKEKLIISKENIYKILVDFSQYDIRRLINLLQELSYHYKSKEITTKRIRKFIKKSEVKNIDVGLFESTLLLLNKYNNYKTIFKLYESEKVLLPLMIHENYKKKIYTKKLEYDNLLYRLLKVSDSISRGDNIETSIYTDQNWYLQNIHGFYTCLNPSYWINKNNSLNLNLTNIKFGSDLNKTSLRNINKKNITNLLKIIPKKSIEEILILSKISNNMMKENNHMELLDIIKSYSKDVSIKEFELFLKIDKTNTEKFELSKNIKIKKQLLLGTVN